jgi:hypothetical protein
MNGKLTIYNSLPKVETFFAVQMYHCHSAALGSQKDQSLNQHSAIQLFSCCSRCEQGVYSFSSL